MISKVRFLHFFVKKDAPNIHAATTKHVILRHIMPSKAYIVQKLCMINLQMERDFGSMSCRHSFVDQETNASLHSLSG